MSAQISATSSGVRADSSLSFSSENGGGGGEAGADSIDETIALCTEILSKSGYGLIHAARGTRRKKRLEYTVSELSDA